MILPAVVEMHRQQQIVDRIRPQLRHHRLEQIGVILGLEAKQDLDPPGIFLLQRED